MANVIICDWCGKVGAENQLMSYRVRKCCSQHDGHFETRAERFYDLCDECTLKIEKMIKPDEDHEKEIIL